MLSVCLLLCLLAVISFGSFTAKHNEIRKYYRKANYKDNNYCILFTEYTGRHEKGHRLVELSGGKTCVLAIWGEAAISAVSLAFAVLLLVKAIIGITP